MTNDWDSTFADADKIDGIAASSSPEQQLMLSNLKSTYPISLSKTVGLKAVTALGATTTRAGIISSITSSRRRTTRWFPSTGG